jgi:NADPH-ferrihemoprotein reductase
MSIEALPEVLDQVIAISKPKTYADVVVFFTTVVAFFAYLVRHQTWDKPDPYYHLWFEKPQLKNGGTRAAAKQTRNIAHKMEDLVS